MRHYGRNGRRPWPSTFRPRLVGELDISTDEEERLDPKKMFDADADARARAAGETRWSEPEPIPNGLLPVQSFDAAFLPASIGAWVADISDRMQCPPEFIGVSALTAMGTLIGRKVGIRPQRHTDWIEVANLWALAVGRPGIMKSPAIEEALRPLRRLEVILQEENRAAQAEYRRKLESFKVQKDVARAALRDKLKGNKIVSIGDAKVAFGKNIEPPQQALEEPEKPVARCYITSDTTYEALGELLTGNPNGVLVHRDELVALLRALDREEFAAARGFFLTAWGGKSPYTFHRIGRGMVHVRAAIVSLLGSTQPARLADYVRTANEGGARDDGLIQRFGLLVWPNQSPTWHDVDRYPESAAKQAAWDTFEHLARLTANDVNAAKDEYEEVPFLRFAAAAQDTFIEWRADLERRVRGGELTPALESHLAKYRGLVPKLALVNHLADRGVGPVSEAALLRALATAEYLETHARRVYASGSEAEAASARSILAHIRKGDLTDGFSARDVHQHDWARLNRRDHVRAGLDLLVDLHWLSPEDVQTGGRPKVIYHVNPRGSHDLPNAPEG
jgi:hypothetical protein